MFGDLRRMLRDASLDQRSPLDRSGDSDAAGDEDTLPADSTGSPVADGGEPDAGVADEHRKEDELDVDDDVLLAGIGQPVFIVDTDCDVAAWNDRMEALTGVSREKAIETDSLRERLGAWGETVAIAEAVLDAPDRADAEHGLEPADDGYTRDITVRTADGDRHVSLVATPLYEGDELVGVVTTASDRTEEVRRQEAVSALVAEVQETIGSLVEGDLRARASFTDEHGVVDPELRGVVDELNEMARNFEDLAARVDAQTETLADSVSEAASATAEIERYVGEQSELLAKSADEMQTFSANMEEVAATADEVASSAEQARAAAAEGLDAGEDAREATDDVVEIGTELVEDVTELGEHMDDIGEVAEVISDIADQTNLLALNANIEAARADEGGEGFAVVADEVKALADQTREHTEEIAGSIDRLQSQTGETVTAAEESQRQISDASERMAEVLDAFEEVSTAIEETADGIAEVSRANDDQAATVEELTASIENVRERAEDTERASERIADATSEQVEAIEELSDRIRELYSDASGDVDMSGVRAGQQSESASTTPDRGAAHSDGGFGWMNEP